MFPFINNSVSSPSDWLELLWVGGKAAWSRHVCQLYLGSKLLLMDWDLREQSIILNMYLFCYVTMNVSN